MYLALEKIVKERYHQNQLKQKVQSPADLEIPPQHPLLESQCRHTGRLLSCTSSIGAVFYLIHIGCSFLFFFLLFFLLEFNQRLHAVQFLILVAGRKCHCLEFLLCMLLRLLALSLIAGENRGWGSVRWRRVRDSGSLFWLLHHHASGNSMHAD